MISASISRVLSPLAALMLATLLTACGDKSADSTDGSAARGTSGSSSGEPRMPLKAISDEDSSDSTSCFINFSMTNTSKENLTMMVEFDPVHAESGALLTGGSTRASAVFSAVKPGATANSVMPGYANVACSQVKLQLISYNCLGDDCELDLQAEGIAGIEDWRGQPRAQPAAETSATSATSDASEEASDEDDEGWVDVDAGHEGSAAAATAELEALAEQLGIRPDNEKLSAAQQALAEAEARDDPLAIAKAQLDSFKATVGNVNALQPKQLRELLPAEIAGLSRGSVKSSSQSMLGMKTSELEAQYGNERLTLKITDSGAAGMAMRALTSALVGEMEREDDDSVERHYREGETQIQESYRKDGSHAELTLILPNGVQIEASGGVAMDALKRDLLPLAEQIAALAREEN